MSRGATQALARNHYKSATAPKPPFYDYTSVALCGGQPGEENSDIFCGRAVAFCANNPPDARGPAVAIHRREVTKTGRPVTGARGQWDQVAITCFPDAVPGADDVLTIAMLQRAFRDTDFTVATVNIQPEGDLTLVNLPTYFQTIFPTTGYGPDEVDTVTLLGQQVQIRPIVKDVTYHLGATTTGPVIGPTTSLGGPYPDGDVIATYPAPGTQQVRADVTYTGQFRVGATDWVDIPGEVVIRGTPVTLTIKEARARLVP
ncbi:MAG: hypothetical protein ACRCSN_21535 [Dermatophilaceae bacterium]